MSPPMRSTAGAKSPAKASADPRGERSLPAAKWPIPISALARMLAVIIPYALGRAYAGGWWTGMGLGDWPVDYAIDDYLYFGFVALTNATARFVGNGFATRVIAVALGAIAVALLWHLIDVALAFVAERTKRCRRAIRLWVLRRRPPGHVIKLGQAAVGATFIALSGIVAWLWLAIVLVTPVAFAERVGRVEAERLRAEFAKPGGGDHYAIVTLSTPVTTRVPLRLVQCTADWCVLAAGKDVHLVPKGTVLHAGQKLLLPPRMPPSRPQPKPTVEARQAPQVQPQ